MKIVFIDSGYSGKIESGQIGGCSIKCCKNGYEVVEDRYEDDDGHGTEVINLFRKYNNAHIFVVKLPTEKHQSFLGALVFALEYIYEKIECDIVQVSCGLSYDSCDLRKIIKKLSKQVSIVSAFDNDGGISYPAAYEEVFGVDLGLEIGGEHNYQIVPSDVVDIRVCNMYYRTLSKGNKYVIVQGSSYACSFISSILLGMKLPSSKNSVKRQLCFNFRQIKEDKKTVVQDFFKGIKKSIIFPMNKEIHSIVRYEDRYRGGVCQYYDLKHKLLVGKKVSDVVTDSNNNKVIQDFNSIDWKSDFDLFVCGHVKEIEQYTGMNLRKEVYKKCKKYGKKLYCFDDMRDIVDSQKNKNIFFPYYDQNDIPKYRYGKLRKPSVPIICVCGTSSRQGKYTTQLKIVEALEQHGIKTGFLSTEPNGLLLGANEMISFGYDSVCLLGEKLTNVVNEMVWRIENNDVKIIVSGNQSGSLQYDTINEQLLMYKQSYFLNGLNPDGLILCVNSYDNMDYVKKTINYLRAYSYADIIFAVINDIGRFSLENKEHISKYFIDNDIPSMELSGLNHHTIYEIILKYYAK